MPTHQEYVTYYWLVGTGLAILVIVLPIFVTLLGKKTDKDFCELRHTTTDKTLAKIEALQTGTQTRLDKINDSVVRVETLIQTWAHKIKAEDIK